MDYTALQNKTSTTGHVHTEAHEKKQYEALKNMTYDILAAKLGTFDAIIAKLEDILFGEGNAKLKELWVALNKCWVRRGNFLEKDRENSFSID